MTTVDSRVKAPPTTAAQLGTALVIAVVAAVLGGGSGLLAALAVLSVGAWVWTDALRSVAIVLTVVTAVLGLVVLSGWSFGSTTSSGSSSGVSHHVGTDDVPPAP